MDISETLARTFLLFAEQQSVILEQHRQTLRLLERVVENQLTVNFIKIDLSKNLRIKRNVGVDQSKKDASTHIKGSVGAFAQTGAIQFVGLITQNITQLQSNPETKAAGEAIKKLADAIAASSDVSSDYERETYLRDLKMLSEQAALPKEKRQIVTPIIDRIAGFCSGAGGLAGIWAIAGPPIIALFS